jgi:hypothetical protein
MVYIRQHTSAYVSIRLHLGVCVHAPPRRSQQQETAAAWRQAHCSSPRLGTELQGLACSDLHTSAYVSIRQHTSAWRQAHCSSPRLGTELQGLAYSDLHTSAYVSIRQHTSAYVSIRQHTSAYVSIRQHTSAYVSLVKGALFVRDSERNHKVWHTLTCIRQHTSAYVSMRLHT